MGYMLGIQQISIHAPLTGSDYLAIFYVFQNKYFNPRSPHRERPSFVPFLQYFSRFQSTLPSQGATGSGARPFTCRKFQSTLPSQGATVKLQMNLVNKIFQSTLPSQGATSTAGASALMSADFNPRSPHRERPLVLHPFRLPKIFQSTLPSQGATWSTL